MIVFETPRNDGEGVSGPPTGMGDVYSAAIQQAWRVDNPLARRQTVEEAYDRRIDAIFRATGQRLANPARLPAPGLDDDTDVERDLDFSRLSRQSRFRRTDPYGDFDAEMRRLATQHPEHAALINAGRSPREDARETARNAERALDDVLQRYGGPWGMGTAAALTGGFRGALSDPANLLGMAIGPMGTVGLGWRQLAWSAIKSGAANAAVETTFQPAIAAWRQEAGLEYGLSNFVANVGGAAALGAGLDAGGRALVRGIQRRRGFEARLDDDGGVIGWGSREQVMQDELERAARFGRDPDLAAAAAGNPKAMRRLADELGLGDDVREAIDRHELELATQPRAPGLDPDEADAHFMQALKHVLDPARELPPAPEAPRPRGETPDIDPELRRQIEAARTPVEAALLLRQRPDLAEGLSLASHQMQVAKALARLSDEAFGAVVEGRAAMSDAALVGQLVRDPLRHGFVLDALTRAEPASPEAARHMIAELLPPPDTGYRAARLDGLDDPTGPEAVRQADELEAMLGDRIASAEARLATGGDDLADKALRDGLADADRLVDLKDFIEACKL